jgi:hypothetical protein
MSVEEKVKKIIAEKLSVELEEVVPEASFVDDLGVPRLRTPLITLANSRQPFLNQIFSKHRLTVPFWRSKKEVL